MRAIFMKRILASWKPWAIVGLCLLAFLPLRESKAAYLLHLGFLTFLYITLSISWNIIGGYAGQISFGHAAFFGLGAYTTALLWLREIPPTLTMPLAGLVAALYSLVIGYPCLRLRGPYFSIATIGVGEATRLLMLNWERLTGGASGLTLPTPAVFTKLPYYYTALILMTLAFLVSYAIKTSKFGLGLFAINMDIDAAETLGVNTTRYQVLALMVSAFMVGVCGSLYSQYMFYIEPNMVFGFTVSISMVLMPTIGGVGTLWGPVIGAIVFIVIQDRLLASFPTLHLLVYGILLVTIILFEPHGISGLFNRLSARALKLARRGASSPI